MFKRSRFVLWAKRRGLVGVFFFFVDIIGGRLGFRFEVFRVGYWVGGFVYFRFGESVVACS